MYQKQEKYEMGLDEDEDNKDEDAEYMDQNRDKDDDDYDEEEDRYGKTGLPNIQGAQGSGNMQDMFANFFKVEQEKYDKAGGQKNAELKQKKKAER